MSGLTSSRVNCAKPREQVYGGVAFGALPRGMPCCERRVPSLRCLVALFVALNTLNYVDRGIIPGASEEFEAFICESRDLGAHGCRHASTFLGLLQSVFIAGFSVASSRGAPSLAPQRPLPRRSMATIETSLATAPPDQIIREV